MITITNGQMTLTVPNSAYHTIYKASGFRPLKDEESTVASADTSYTSEEEMPRDRFSVEEKENFEEPDDYDEEENVDLSEIPLSEMDFYQLCDYADQLGLDRSGIRSKKELRILIKNHL